MKLLGYLFVFGILLAVVGYVRGWFTVEAASKDSSALKVTVDRGQVAKDAHGVMDKIGATSASGQQAPATVASDVVEGRITAVMAASRQITVDVAARAFVHDVPASVPITRAGERIGFEQLRPDLQVRLTFDGAEPVHRLLRIEILP